MESYNLVRKCYWIIVWYLLVGLRVVKKLAKIALKENLNNFVIDYKRMLDYGRNQTITCIWHKVFTNGGAAQ